MSYEEEPAYCRLRQLPALRERISVSVYCKSADGRRETDALKFVEHNLALVHGVRHFVPYRELMRASKSSCRATFRAAARACSERCK